MPAQGTTSFNDSIRLGCVSREAPALATPHRRLGKRFESTVPLEGLAETPLACRLGTHLPQSKRPHAFLCAPQHQEIHLKMAVSNKAMQNTRPPPKPLMQAPAVSDYLEALALLWACRVLAISSTRPIVENLRFADRNN
jgi:hypothetical protein